MTDIYCSIGKPPSGARLGTMKECAEKKQIRYYGIKKVDPKLVEMVKGKKTKKKDRISVLRDINKLKGKISKMEKQISASKDKDEKDDLRDELKEIKLKHNDLVKMFNSMKKPKRSTSRNHRSRSRSRSRSHSRSRSRYRSRSRSRRRTNKSRTKSRRGSIRRSRTRRTTRVKRRRSHYRRY